MEFVNVKSSKQNKTFSKKLEQNSSDSKDDNDLISHQSSSDSETSGSEDESSDEPSRFIKKYFKLFSSKPSENHKKNSSSESTSNSSSSEDEQESISEQSKSTKKSAKPSKEPKKSSSSIETSSSEDESISEPSKSTKKSANPSTKEPKNNSSKIPENYQSTSDIETSSSEDDEQQSISVLSDSNKKSTKNRSCSKSFENTKKPKLSEEISSKKSNETSSKTSEVISSTSSSETSSSSDDEEKLINEPTSSAKPPMTSSYVKQPLSKPSEEAKKDSSKTPKQMTSKTPKQISSKTPKQISSNIESSSSDSEEDSIPPPVKPKKKPTKKSTSNQSKTRSEKSTFEPNKNDSEKSYEDFSPIMDGYGDLLDHLNPEDPKSEVDKVVKFILEKNILVRHMNVALCRYTNIKGRDFRDLHKQISDFKVGRYSSGDFGDDGRLIKRWNELVETVPIVDPDQCIKDFSQLKKGDVLKKRNVLGCFLGQDLPHVRHCADVFYHVCSLLNPLKSGKFSNEENHIILEEAKKFGACLSTWKNVTLKLNRKCVNTIAKKYTALTKGQSLFTGLWSLTEDEVLLESLFCGRKNAGIEEIKSLAYKDFELCSEKLNRSKQNVSDHWRHILMPILLSYHYGTLHQPWRRDFFEYLIEKKVAGVQDIDYLEASSFFPEQSAISFVNSISCFAKKQSKEKKPLFQIIEENLHSFKDPQETERVRNYRETIVRIYDEVKNRTI
jgi:hypothetical protein